MIYRRKMAQYEEYKQMEDLSVVKVADVVGMTTTGAAKLQTLLKLLNPAVVIVEEAAEVLEAHVVASLTNKCEHVILIGDHKQLKPCAAVYELCKNYNIDVSLFERMINNGMYCPMLNVQHRMRPEIARLISPSIYPNLENHDDVTKYGSIKGVKKNTNVFFVTHNNFELIEDDSMTKKNPFEAKFMIQLARYLVLQGYSPSSITILTTYAGQMYLLRDLKKQHERILRDVRCIVVDKYQGEENDIVLLSLVRSNEDGKIGFLNIQNRVCVALSRAKTALYMIGNMEMLSKCDLWAGVKQILDEQQAIGDELQLYCERHDKYTSVSKADDFDLVREGGCAMICGELLACGHNCKSLCHTINRDHAETCCREACTKTCPRMHPCELKCFAKCRPCVVLVERVLQCGHHKRLACHINEADYKCQVPVEDVLPLCGHPVTRQCGENVENICCTKACSDRLDCGHACRRNCHKNNDPDHITYKCRQQCEKMNKNCQKAHKCQKLCFEECGQCTIMESFQLICGHNHKLPCSTDLAEIQCFYPCEKICADCKKPCRKLCHANCSPCINKVKKKIEECGHTVTVECHSTPVRSMCRKKCESTMACGHRCRADCCKPCHLEKCLEFVKSYDVKPLCGHDYVKVPCYKKDEVGSMMREEFLPLCDVPCDVLLKCGDPCSGSCGQCWQGRLHLTCQKECGTVLICGHTCANPCRQLCPPCDRPCQRECKHSKCPRKCGAPCVPCQEPCDWRCKHMKCTRKCGAFCDRPPCYEPCRKKLACGHRCVGFCGEPCPPQCRICNPEITEIMYGYEDEEDARFVYLEDCEHTIESRAMEMHLSTSVGDNEIVMKVCPLCKTAINRTLRFGSHVKRTYRDIASIKKIIYGQEKLLTASRMELMHDLETLLHRRKSQLESLGMESLAEIIRTYCVTVEFSKNKRHHVSQLQLNCIQYYCRVASVIVSRVEDLILASGIENDRVKLTAPQHGLRRGLRSTQPQATPYTNDEAKAAVGRAVELTKSLTKRIAQARWTINDQQIDDFNDELRRYNKLVDLSVSLVDGNYRLNRNDEKVAAIRQKIENVVYGIRKFTESDEKTAETLFKELEVELKSPKPLTREEKIMINLAMSTSFHSAQKSGHWFMCSNGHYYCITECGGAMQTSRCPEFGETIGGSNHRTVSTSRLAGDMDGATHAAWGDVANMLNYRFY